MTSTTTISELVIEPNVATVEGELNEKEKLAKRFKPTNLKRNNQFKHEKQPSSASSTIVRPLRAKDIKEHRLWAFASLILCFFLIGPCFAYYHSRRIRVMKNNQELTRAKTWSDRVNNILIISNIIGIVVWIAIIFIIAVLLIMGKFY
jgi:hypothetical protein